MKINNLSFPYPVLGIGDDIEPRPSITKVGVEKTNKTFFFDFTLDMRNRDIAYLVSTGYAKYACEVESPRTLLRRCYFSSEPKFHLELLRTDLAEKVTFQFSIVVIRPLTGYSNSNVHEDYYGLSFDLEPGDLLAFIGQSEYDVDIKYDELRSVGSFMQITEGKVEKQPKYDLGGDKINIKLPSGMYDQYRESILGNRLYTNIIHSSLVFNALVTALLFYHENEHTLWARTLRYRIENDKELQEFRDALDNGDAEELISLAQILLMNPYQRLFDTLSATNSNDDD